MAALQKCPFCPPETRPQPVYFGMCKYHFDHPGECKKTPAPTTVIVTDIKLPGVKKESEKRGIENRQYLKLRKAFLAVNPFCMAQLEGCGKYADQVHHKCGRIGRLLTDVTKFLPVCASCHNYITEAGEQAIEMGLSLRRVT